MKYCVECGTELIMKYEEDEGMVPFCPKCKEYRYPMFNDAVSMVVMSPGHDKILLIQQYGHKHNILVAGYLNKGEEPKHALVRELAEETNLQLSNYAYNDSRYYERTNTLIHNFLVTVKSEDFILHEGEVDYAKWYSLEEAKKAVWNGSLAEELLNQALDKYKNGVLQI